MEQIPTRWLESHQATLEARPIGEFLQILERRKWLILVSMLLAATLAAVFAFGRDRLFQAETRLLIDPRGMRVVDNDITPRSQTDGASSALVESQMRVITSGDVLSKVVAEENLSSDKEFLASGLLDTLRGELAALLRGSGEPAPPELTALEKLRTAVTTDRPRGSYIIDVLVRTKSPTRSAEIANAIAETYVEYETRAHAKLARRGSGALDDRIIELRNELSEAEQNVEEYKSKNDILSSSGALVNEQALTRLNELLVSARDRAAAAESAYQQVQAIRESGKIPDTLPEAVDSTTLGNLRLAYNQTRQMHQAMSSRLLPGHPSMRTAGVQLDTARAAVNAEIARIASAARAERDRQRSHVADLERQVDELKAEAFTTNDKMLKLRELTREADAKRAVYEAFLVRAKELGEQENVRTDNVRIISAATPPLKPVGPSSVLIIALGLVGGLGFGILLAFALESFRARADASYRA